MRTSNDRGLLLPFLLLGVALASEAASPPKPTAPTKTTKLITVPKANPAPDVLQIESATELSGPLRYAVDVRWASEKSVFLALLKKGTVEASLDPSRLKNGEILRQLIPGDKLPGGFWVSLHLAASPGYLVVAGPLFEVTWRTLTSSERRSQTFDGLFDVDVRGSRAVALGVRWDDKQEHFSPDGAIAWTLDLDRKNPPLKPILFDVAGPGAASANNCGIALVGATRFLADGSLIVVPGVQPGIYRFDPKGKLQKTVDTASLGLDSDCRGISDDLRRQLRANFQRRMAWLNDRRIVDDILPLAEGVGLLIRSVREGQVHWVLKILGDGGAIREVQVPVQPKTSYARLKGDVRSGKLALVLFEFAASGMPDEAPPSQLLVATLPRP